MDANNNTGGAGANGAAEAPLLGYTPNMVGATVPTAEEEKPEKEKRPLGPLITIIVLAILTLGFGLYMVIDLIKGEPKCPECAACPDPGLAKVQVVDFEFDSVAVLYQGEVYVNIDGTSTEFNSLYGAGTWDVLAGVRQNYKKYEFGDSSVRLNNEDFTGMKLAAKNVVGVFDYQAGQEMRENYGLLLLYEDGTVGYSNLSTLIAGETAVTPVDGVTEIINIITRKEFSGAITYAITRSGSEVRLSKYIPDTEAE